MRPLLCRSFARLFDSEYHAVWDGKRRKRVAAFFISDQGTQLRDPPPGYFEKLAAVLEARKILLVDDEIKWDFIAPGKFWAIENFNVKWTSSCSAGAHQRTQSAVGRLGARGVDRAGIFAQLAFDVCVKPDRTSVGPKTVKMEKMTREHDPRALTCCVG